MEKLVNQRNYKLLPFRFMRLGSCILVVNQGGDFLIIKNGDFDRFVNYRLQRDEAIYLDLKSKHFLYEDNIELPVQLLATQYRTKKSFLRNFTALHMVVVTLRCTQKCKYCQVSSEKADASQFDMGRDVARKCVDLIFQSPSPYIKIEFQGGEPVLNFETVKFIVEYAEKLNSKYNKYLEFVLCTNLTIVNKYHLDYCKQHGIHISTSVDGPPDIHNSFRQMEDGEGSFDKVVAGLELAQQVLGRKNIAALMAATRICLGRFPDIVDQYVELGFHSIFFRALNPYGRACENKTSIGYDTSEFVKSYCEGLDYIIDLNLRGVFFIEEYARLILTRILTPFSTGFVDLQSPTGAGIGGVIYDYDGGVYVADEGRMLARRDDKKFRMGNVRDSYHDLFGGNVVRETVASSCVECLPQCSECAFQMWCGADPVRNYAAQGDMIGHRPTSEFCRKNIGVIRYIFDKIDSGDDEVLNVFWSWITNRPLESICSFGLKET